MAHFRSMFHSDYVGSWELPKGKDFVVVISRVEAGELNKPGRSDKKLAPILHFEGKKKGMVLNKTNACTIEELYGSETDNWIGKRIAIYATTTKFGRQTVDCIRIRDRVPAAGAKTVAQPPPRVTEDGEVVEQEGDTGEEESAVFRDLMAEILDARTVDDMNEALHRVDEAESALSQEQLVKLVQVAKEAEKTFGKPYTVVVPNAG